MPSESINVRWIVNTVDNNGNIERYLYTSNNTSDGINSSGTIAGHSEILKLAFEDDIKNAYILAEVRLNTQSNLWYPVSFLDVTLEKSYRAMTENELSNLNANDKNAYKHRFEEDLRANQALYAELEHISFEKSNEILNAADETGLENQIKRGLPHSNFTSEEFKTEAGEDVESYYAFSYMDKYEDRGKWAKVMKGEYALYRTLNYPEISKSSTSYQSERGATSLGPGRYYGDFFASIYNRHITDRLWEKTKGTQSGYFMYVDASETPGVISKIPINDLCPNTSLIVNAWICDVSRNSATQDRVPANVGFTLKAVSRDDINNKTEKILAKYYSGAFTPKPTSNAQGAALWQQVSFKFSFSDRDIKTDDEFILEISSNCEGSTGADFGIDEISVFKTLPAITAQREDACESSVLMVSTDYETLQSNMTWDIDDNVIDKNELSNPDYRIYRYGMMGNDPYAAVDEILHANFGNVYFAFTEVVGDDKQVGDWVVLNNHLKGEVVGDPEVGKLGLEYTMRIAVQTDMNKVDADHVLIPDNPEDAKRSEIVMNVRAMNDFLEDVKRGNRKEDEHEEHVEKLTSLIDKFCERKLATGQEAEEVKNPLKIVEDEDGTPLVYTEKIMKNELVDFEGKQQGLGDLYEEAIAELYACLGIPRIRCPWTNKDRTILYLSEIDVHNTELRFAGEIYEKDKEKVTARGEYYVVLFSAKQIAASNDPAAVLDLDSDCALKKIIYVMPSTTIAVETETDENVIACVGRIQSVDANLRVAKVDDVGNIISSELIPFEEAYLDHVYTFDWYLGTEEQFNDICSELNINNLTLQNLQDIIAKLRDELSEDGYIDKFDVDNVRSSNLNENEKNLLERLLGGNGSEPLLASGNGNVQFRFVEQVYAMPYIPDIETIKDDMAGNPIALTRSFCAEGEWIPLAEGTDVPGLNIGFPDIDYSTIRLTDVPLRLGLGNLKDNTTRLTIPIQNNITFGVAGNGHVLKALQNPSRHKVLLQESGTTYREVGNLISLFAQNREEGQEYEQPNSLTLQFTMESDEVESYFKEGGTYSLYIPFGEYKSANAESPIDGSCEGTAYLQIKIIPEYLTWTGDTDAVWYNDGNWKQSTEKELYMGNKAETDANGSDVITNAFAPLYFTKITIKENNVLQLSKENGSTLSPGTGATPNIQYDMAVNNTGTNNAIKVVPYYGNKVSEIYFKPKAKLVNQHYLDYEKARVEFEMSNGAKRWFASPLQGVYAGDFYAPTTTSRQETEAFTEIKYDADNYSIFP